MVGIVVVFPKKENAVGVRNLLARGGINVTGICTTGSHAIQLLDMYDEGLIICGYRLSDMHYLKLREDLPKQYGMLLVASRDKWADRIPDGVQAVSMPVKAYELLNTVEDILREMSRRRKKRQRERKVRDSGQRELIDQAKLLLMEKKNLSEEEAHRYIQKHSMNSGTNMVETAQMILELGSQI